MAETRFVDVKGKVKFIHAANLNKFGDFSITFYPDNASLEIIRDYQAKGWKNMMKKDDDGYFISFKRAPTKMIRGKTVHFKAPIVKDEKGNDVDGARIGWGSDVTVRLEVYQHGTPTGGKAFANRWDSLIVHNLVEYVPQSGTNPKSLTDIKPQEEWYDR